MAEPQEATTNSDFERVGFRVVEKDEGRLCDCGQPIPTQEVWSGDHLVHTHRHRLCDLCEAKRQREEEAEEEASRRYSAQLKLKEVSHNDERLATVTFEGMDRTEANTQAIQVAEKWCDMDLRPNLFIFGAVGCGKTYLARCAYNLLMERGEACQWLNVAELVDEARAGFNDREAGWSAQKARSLARTAPVLFLDDLGKNKPGEGGWLEEILYSIVDPRYRYELPTVITTEFLGQGLIERVGEAVVTRLAHGALKANIKRPAVPYRRSI